MSPNRSDPLREALGDVVREALRDALDDALPRLRLDPPAPVEVSWRERLWTCHPETRLDVSELSEALGRPRSGIYKLTSAAVSEAANRQPIPHRKDMSGGLVFVAGEVRAWIRATEEPVVEGESWTPGDQRPPYLKAS